MTMFFFPTFYILVKQITYFFFTRNAMQDHPSVLNLIYYKGCNLAW